MVDARERPPAAFVTVDGRRLEIATFEPPAAGEGAARPPIVMLHEGLGSLALWKSFPAELAASTGSRVVAYSRYGYGNSDVPSGRRDVRYMHHEAETVLPELLDTLGIERPVLFGHSDGASIALVFAGRFPERAAALVLEAPHVFVEERSIEGILRAKTVYETTDMRAKLGRYHRDPERTFRGWNDIWLDPHFRAWNIEASLPSIACPVLVVQGYDDEYGTTAQVDAIAAAVPGTSAVLLEDCAHSPHRDRTEATLAATVAFLERLRPCDADVARAQEK